MGKTEETECRRGDVMEVGTQCRRGLSKGQKVGRQLMGGGNGAKIKEG